MSNNKLSIAFIVLIFFGLIISSCEKEFVVENYDPAINQGNPDTTGVGDTTGIGDTSRNCKACAYIPVCNGATYTYADTMLGQPASTTQNIQIVKDTLIGSLTFQKLADGNFMNCKNGETTTLAYNQATAGGATIPEVRLIMLKANEPVGSTWTSTIDNNGTLVEYVYKIVYKGEARTVAGRNYTDVINVNMITYTSLGGVRVEYSKTDYFYARGVGLIEAIIYNSSTGGSVQYHRVLQSYLIP